MTWYAFWDAADAFVETAAFQDAMGWMLVAAAVLFVVVWWRDGRPRL